MIILGLNDYFWIILWLFQKVYEIIISDLPLEREHVFGSNIDFYCIVEYSRSVLFWFIIHQHLPTRIRHLLLKI